MSPIPLGILAAQFDAPIVGGGDFDLLETQVLASAEASVVFDNLDTLAAGYQHLQIRMTTRQTGAFTILSNSLRLGAPTVDTGNNYATHWLRGDGSSVTSGASASSSIIEAGYSPAASATSGMYSATVIDILDPFNSSKNATVRVLTGYNSRVGLYSGVWMNTAPIETIFIRPATNWEQYSRFSLYGIKTGA